MKKIIDKYLKRTQDYYHQTVFLEFAIELIEFLKEKDQKFIDIIDTKNEKA